MDTVLFQNIIKETLIEYTKIPYSYGEIEYRTVFDSENDNYCIVTLGWHGAKRIHGCLIHLEIIDGKIWVQRDDTEDGVTYDLVDAGIPKDKIVLGFHPPNVRPHTGYAIA